jgi:hypothetical protein
MQITDTSMTIPLAASASRRRSRVQPHQLRINQEGIFCNLPVFSTLIPWDEIAALVPYTYHFLGDYPVLGIVPRDYNALITRTIEKHAKHAWQKAWYHLLDSINTWFSHGSNALTPIHVYESTLPISIDELLATIQERFAVELCEHHVTIRHWQP